MATPKFRDVDDYIAQAVPESRPVMRDIRALIKEIVPAVDESISWNVPFYKHHGMLCGFSVYKAHVSFGLVVELPTEVSKLLHQNGYQTGKKTVQIKFDQPLPEKALRKLILTQAQANAAKQAGK